MIYKLCFVVAKNAEKEPEIIKRMLRENHIVGLHSLEHKMHGFIVIVMLKRFY